MLSADLGTSGLFLVVSLFYLLVAAVNFAPDSKIDILVFFQLQCVILCYDC